MARRIKLKPGNKQQQLSRSLKQPYGARRVQAASLSVVNALITDLTISLAAALPKGGGQSIDKFDPLADSRNNLRRDRLKGYISELEALVSSPDQAADVATQVMSLEHQVAAEVDSIISAPPAGLDVNALKNFEKAYRAVSAKILDSRVQIDTLPQAASYFDDQRLQGHKEKTAELSQGVAQAITTAKTALIKLDQVFRPAAFKTQFKKSADNKAWEASLETVCREAESLDGALRQASESFDYKEFVLHWHQVSALQASRFTSIQDEFETWQTSQLAIIAEEERVDQQAVAAAAALVEEVEAAKTVAAEEERKAGIASAEAGKAAATENDARAALEAATVVRGVAETEKAAAEAQQAQQQLAVAGVEAKITELTSEIEVAQTAVTSMAAEVNQAKKDAQQAEGAVRDAEIELGAKIAAETSRVGDLSTAAEQLAKAKKIVEDKETELKELREKTGVAGLAVISQTADKDQEVVEAKKAVAQAEAVVLKKQAQVDSIKIEVAAVQARIAEARMIQGENAGIVTTKETESEAANETLKIKQGELGEAQQKLAEEQSKAEEANSAVRQKEEELAAAGTAVQEKKAVFDQKEEEAAEKKQVAEVAERSRVEAVAQLTEREKALPSAEAVREQKETLAQRAAARTDAREKLTEAVATSKAMIEREQASVTKLVADWSAYRGLDASEMHVAAVKAVPFLLSAQQFTTPVDYKIVAAELAKLKEKILIVYREQVGNIENAQHEVAPGQDASVAQAAHDAANERLVEATAKAELAMAGLVIDAVSQGKSTIQQLLSAPNLAGSPAETYAKQVRDYCKQFVSPIHLLHRCAEDQEQFKKDYAAIEKDLKSDQFHSDKSYKAAINQRLSGYQARVAANKILLQNLAVETETLPAEKEALKAQIKAAQTALEAEAKKCQELFEKQMKAADAANDKLELQTLVWSTQDVKTLEIHFETQFKEQYPNANEATRKAAVAKHITNQKKWRNDFLNGQGISAAALEEIKKINITAELDSMRTFDFGGITAEMRVIRKGEPTGPGEVAKVETSQPGTYQISIRETNPTPEAEEALGRFLKLLAERGKNPPSKPVGKVILSNIAEPFSLFSRWTKASKEAYKLERALFYGKTALKNGVKLEITDPEFTPELRQKYDAAMAGYQARYQSEQDVDNYCTQLSLTAAGRDSQRRSVGADGTVRTAHRVEYPMPEVLREVHFSSVAELVAGLPREGREGDVLATAIDDALRLLAGAPILAAAPNPVDDGDPAQKLKSRIAALSTTLDAAVKVIDTVEKQYPGVDLTDILLAARKQWARMMVANTLLAEVDRSENSVQLTAAGNQLFQGAEGDADKKSMLEQAYLAVHGQVWIKGLEALAPANDGGDFDRGADAGIHAVSQPLSRLIEQLTTYAKQGTPNGLAYAEGGRLRQYSLLLEENARGGFQPLNKMQLLERMAKLAAPLEHAKDLAVLTKELEAARTALSEAQATATETAALDPAKQAAVTQLETRWEAKKAELAQSATNLLSEHQLEIAEHLKEEDFAPLVVLCQKARQIFDHIQGRQVQLVNQPEVIDAIKGADATKHAENLEQAFRGLAKNPAEVSAAVNAVFIERSGYEPTAHVLELMQSTVMQAYCKAVLVDEKFNLNNAKPPSSFRNRQVQNIGSKELPVVAFALAANQYLARLTQAYDKAKELAAGNAPVLAEIEAVFKAHLVDQIALLEEPVREPLLINEGDAARPLLYTQDLFPVRGLKHTVTTLSPNVSFTNQTDAIKAVLATQSQQAREEQQALQAAARNIGRGIL